MSKRKPETGFGDDIDQMLDSDDEGVLMTGGAAEDDDVVGGQPSALSADDEAMDEEAEAEDMEGETEQYDETEDVVDDEDIAVDEEDETQGNDDTNHEDNSGNNPSQWGFMAQQPTQATQLDDPEDVEPSNKMKKLAMQRARARVKRATSMYMLFSVHTGATLEKGTSFKDRAAIIKSKYGEMVEEPARKAEWEERAAADKARFEKELAAAYETELAVVLRDGIAEEVMLSAGDALSSVARRQELVLPLARVRKTVKMDPEVKNIAKDGAVAMAKATELFIAFMGVKCAAVAALRGGKTIQERDFIHMVSTSSAFEFLREDFPRRAEDEGARKKQGGGGGAKGSKGSQSVGGEETEGGGEGDGTGSEVPDGAAAEPSAKKKSKLQEAAAGSAQLGAFFQKAPAGAPLVAAPLRPVAPKASPLSAAAAAASSSSASKSMSKGKGKGRGRGRPKNADASAAPAPAGAVDEDEVTSTPAEEPAAVAASAEEKEKERPAARARRSRGGSKAKGGGGEDRGNSLLDMFGATASSSSSSSSEQGAKPAADIEDLV